MAPQRALLFAVAAIAAFTFTLLLAVLNASSPSLQQPDDTPRRRLQFEDLFATPQAQKMRRKKAREAREARGGEGGSDGTSGGLGSGGGGGGGRGGRGRPMALAKAVEEILLNADRFHLWWTGPPESDTFKPASWGAMHTESTNAIFTMAFLQGQSDYAPCSTPNDFKLFLGTARAVFSGDIVIAVEAGLPAATKAVLAHYKAVVYEIPHNLCAKETKAIYCGSHEERVPASVFRYFFYQKWAAAYNEQSMLMLADFRDVLFQSDPFAYRTHEWLPDAPIAVFQEFHPNMVINRCRFNARVMQECYGAEVLRTLGGRVIVSSGGAIGSRDAILAWSHAITLQLQEAPGRAAETRCTSGGIDHAFVNFLVYSNKLRPLMRVKVHPQGEGAINTLGGLRPNTVTANITGDLSFWRVLQSGTVLNWNGEPSPAVHQLDHFYPELEAMVRKQVQEGKLALSQGGTNAADIGWQALLASRCLWGCDSSPKMES